ncbi:MAG: hypothetical protein JRM85_06845 [Nitrososphaerota archaeon]|nr:hypothetical protein [Nitrososphaerota archaeon]
MEPVGVSKGSPPVPHGGGPSRSSCRALARATNPQSARAAPPLFWRRGRSSGPSANSSPKPRSRGSPRRPGVIERERKLKRVPSSWAILLGFGVDTQRSLAGFHFSFLFWARIKNLSYAGYYLRFTSERVLLLQRCLELALANLAGGQGRALDPRFKAFSLDVPIKDSDIVRLRASLTSKFPATRSRKVAAGLEVDTLVSVGANGPKSVALVGEGTTHVNSTWTAGASARGEPCRTCTPRAATSPEEPLTPSKG